MKLLVKAPNWIGDCVMATPAVAFLREALPMAKITVLSRTSTAGIWQHHPLVDELVVADDRNLPATLQHHLRQQHFDAAILFPNSFRAAWLAWRLGVPRRFGYNRMARAWLLTDPLVFRRREWQTPTPQPLTRKSIRPVKGAASPRHMVEYYLRLAGHAVAGLRQNPPSVPKVDRERALPPLVLPVREYERTLVAELLRSLRIVDEQPLIGIHPGAAYGGAKRWPLDRLATAANILASELKAAVVITAGPSEKELSGELQRHLRCTAYDLGARLDLPKLAALLERLALFIGNDTGVTHMAAAVGTPTVAIFGPMDWNVTHPWSARSIVVRRSPPCAPCFLRECPLDHRCMLDIAPTDVVDAAHRLLIRTRGVTHEPA
ncbi:MAG: glycosyltransferase family 9 protein [Candidatus Sumerlaeaceae bacterium]|nr:glycosyltransferase family 9 protein [Candidatus Sumerlaeaceae bacterium]